jgi:ribonucleoside-diphosphate reductase alpha chain
VEDVKGLYRLAYETGCKGISYMREGSREGTLIRGSESAKEQKSIRAEEQEGNGLDEQSALAEATADKPMVWARPTKVNGATYKLGTPMGRAFITVNHDEDGSPVEVFINIGRAGSDIQAMAEALGRLISKSLKMGSSLSIKERAMVIIDQLSGISSGRSMGFGSKKIVSLPDAVAKALAMDMGLIGFSAGKESGGPTSAEAMAGRQEFSISEIKNDSESMQLSISKDGEPVAGVAPKHLGTKVADICPDCGNATLVHEMGCKTCHGCGYSEC